MHCAANNDCPFQYFCTEELACEHFEVFPIQAYPLFVYILIPFVVSVCNIGGLSAGAFRILIFMNMLNYPVSKANSLIFIIITAAAMANFFTIVPRRHPRMNAPLVDYNLVYIMMPTLIFGTNLGVFLNKLLIELVQDILVSLVLIFFAVVYTRKFLEYRRNSKSRELLELISETNNEISADEEGKPDRTHTQSFERRQSRTPWLEMLLTLGVFVAVQAMASITEGAFFGVKHCTLAYYLCFTGLFVIVSGLIGGTYALVRRKMDLYESMNFNYELDLKNKKVFAKLILGGLIAGLVQGLVGLGSCFIVIFVLLQFKVLPQVASAVSGYIIVFVGWASLLQALVVGDLEWKETIFLFGLTFGGSLVITFIARHFLKNRMQAADTVVILILAFISIFSLAGVGVSIGLTIKDLGFASLITLKDFCSKTVVV